MIFLTSRKQQVLVDGIKSSIFDVTSSLLQGAGLISINLMAEKVMEDGLYLFADSLKLYKEILSNEGTDKHQK